MLSKSAKWDSTRHFIKKVDSNYRGRSSFEYTNRSYPIWAESPDEWRFLMARYYLWHKYAYELPFIGGSTIAVNVWKHSEIE